METLPTTLQDYFNIAWNHAVVKKEPPSVDAQGYCLYRGPDGCRCLIGAAIPDEKYDPKIEKELAAVALRLVRMTNLEAILDYQLNRLQECHDTVAKKPDYHTLVRKNLELFADQYHCEIPEETPA